MSLAEKLRLLLEWSPAIHLFAAIASAKRGQDRAIELAKLGEFLASKTTNSVDDRLVRLITDILLTSQAGALIDYVSDLMDEAVSLQDEPNRRPRS